MYLTYLFSTNSYQIYLYFLEEFYRKMSSRSDLPFSEEVIKTDYEPEGSTSPDRLYATFRENGKTRYDGVEGSSEKVTIFANSDSGDIWKTEVWINKSTKLIDKAVLFARNGSEYTYEMTDIKTNTGVSDQNFNVNETQLEDDGWIVTDQSEG